MVASVALGIPGMVSSQWSTIPNVKKITICHKNSTQRNKIDDWSVVGKVFQYFPKLKTLEFRYCFPKSAF